MHVCVFIYTVHHKYIQHTQILCTQKLLFWMQLIVINHCPTLKKPLTFIIKTQQLWFPDTNCDKYGRLH